jgi:tryptophan synthase beta subunit
LTGFVPTILDTTVFDEVMRVSGSDAAEAARRLASSDGILGGISSGAAMCAASRLAEREELSGGTIVVILPDTGDRYLNGSVRHQRRLTPRADAAGPSDPLGAVVLCDSRTGDRVSN